MGMAPCLPLYCALGIFNGRPDIAVDRTSFRPQPLHILGRHQTPLPMPFFNSVNEKNNSPMTVESVHAIAPSVGARRASKSAL